MFLEQLTRRQKSSAICLLFIVYFSNVIQSLYVLMCSDCNENIFAAPFNGKLQKFHLVKDNVRARIALAGATCDGWTWGGWRGVGVTEFLHRSWSGYNIIVRKEGATSTRYQKMQYYFMRWNLVSFFFDNLSSVLLMPTFIHMIVFVLPSIIQ